MRVLAAIKLPKNDMDKPMHFAVLPENLYPMDDRNSNALKFYMLLKNFENGKETHVRMDISATDIL